MTGQIHTESRYLVHESGTKFYETVIFLNADEKKFAVVKRWGKIGVAGTGGGEIIVDTHSMARSAQAASEKIIEGKRKRGYNFATSTHGFHGTNVAYKDAGSFVAAVGRHYKLEGARREVLSAMYIDDKTIGDDPNAAIIDDIVSETPEPEPERDDNYGSW